LVCPESEEGLRQWIDKYTIMEEISVTPRGDLKSISLIGPEVGRFSSDVLEVSPEPGYFLEVGEEGRGNLISRRPDFGGQRFDIITNIQHEGKDTTDITAFVEALPRVDSTTYETYRILRGIPGYGHEVTTSYNPYEAGLSHLISSTKGCYIGQEVVARLDTYKKVQKILVGVALQQEKGPSVGSVPLFHKDQDVGRITSIAPATYGGFVCGLAIVRKEILSATQVLRIGAADSVQHAALSSFPMNEEALGKCRFLLLDLANTMSESQS
jgi:folate-binding protein YgfZ